MNKEEFIKKIKKAKTREELNMALKSIFGDHSPYVWGDDNEIDWGDGWWTSIWECCGNDSHTTPAYSLLTPPEGTTDIPLIYDSPHSGSNYPEDFNFAANFNTLRLCEDTYIDSIIQDNILKGASVVKANFPRSYIDPNRAPDSLSERDIKGPLKKLSAKNDFNAANGRGLIWMRAQKSAIYDKKSFPTEDDITKRLDTYYTPYHDALAKQIKSAKEKHGFAYHINWHSCPRYGSPTHKDPNKKRADFILGDRKGTTFDPKLLKRIKGFLENKGYSVAINTPYPGAEIVQRHSAPDQSIYSLQIEICRDLYMDEVTLEPHQGIRDIASVARELTEDIKTYISELSPEPKTRQTPKP
jgi:N-formylglutamate amidohydrolase